MTYNEIVKIGESAGQHELHFFSSFTWWQYALYIGIFFLILYLTITFSYWSAEFLVALLIVFMVFVIPIVTWGFKASEIEAINIEEINEYKLIYGDKYIESLEENRKELLYLKIDNEAEVTGVFMLGSGRIKSDMMAIYSLIYKDGEDAVAQNMKVAPSLSLSENENPYISYKELNQYLPHYEKGKYNIKLYLPKDYKFTDIK